METEPQVNLETEQHQSQESGAAAELARQSLLEILQRMGYELTVTCQDEAERILLSIEGEEHTEVIGRKGQTLDALQFIVNRVLNHHFRDERRSVVVDAGGYRERRVEALRELAERLGEKASSSGKVVAVNPMSPHDRRVIHMTLKETPGVTTRSEGEGDERRLLIVPE